MELFPYQALNTASLFCLGLLYDTYVPDGGERDIHSTFNDAIAIRVLQRTMVTTAPYRLRYQPVDISAFPTKNFYPSWVELGPKITGVLATVTKDMTRVIPKVRLPALDSRFILASAVNQYNESVATTILAHKIGTQYLFTNTGTYCHMPTYNVTEEGWWLCAEYDFGAEMEVKGLTATTVDGATPARILFNTQNTMLQALVDGVWTDAVDLYSNLRVTSGWSTSGYALPNSIKAQKFRIVNKNATNPWNTGFYTFGLQFYGNYTGVKPRTLGKYKHMTILNLVSAATYSVSTVWNFVWPAQSGTVMGRYYAMTHMTVTDDIKQGGVADLMLSDASYYPSLGEAPVPTFNIKASALLGRGV